MTNRKGTSHAELMERLTQNPEFRKQRRMISPFYRISAAIIARRGLLGITQKELAERADTHQTRISKIESSDLDIRLSTLIDLAEALECHLEVNFTPIKKEVDESDAPYQLLFGTNTRIVPGTITYDLDVSDIQYKSLQTTEGYNDHCG